MKPAAFPSLRVGGGLVPLAAVLLLSFGGLGWRLYHLQVSNRSEYVQSSRKQQFAYVRCLPQRGMIIDCRKRIIAASSEVYNLFAEPRRLGGPEQIKAVAGDLQELLDIPSYEISKAIWAGSNPGFVRIYEHLTLDQRERLAGVRIPGIGIENAWRRYYPAGRSACHVIGFIGGTEKSGLAGLELKYDGVLRGEQGQEAFAVDVLRRPIGASPDQSRPVVDGQSLVLTLDVTIQQFVRRSLEAKMKEYRAESAVGVVMDPWSGAILAMVSLPDYDPLQFSKTDPDRLRNRALTDPFEPGSIFKPIVAAIALDAGVITTTEKIDCENGYWGRFRIGEFGNHRYGLMDVGEILQESSNIGMAKIGLKLTPAQLYEGVRLFGFGKKTGIDLPGEDSGFIYPTDKWSKYSPTRIAFGHEVLVTAVQVAQAYCILANGGSLVRPHLVKAVIDCQGQITEFTPSGSGTGYVVKPEVAHWIVCKALVDAVNEGTGDQAAIEGIPVWGKTGTANIALPGGGYDTRSYVASFAGGAPAEHPALVVLVSIRKPDRSLGKGYSGGRVAAPVAKEILEQSLSYLGLK
jgi:cell division protein FtsI/penicillin-binding protein 2